VHFIEEESFNLVDQ